MKKYIYIFALLFFYACNDSKQINYYQSGKVKAQGFLMDDKFQGEWVYFEKNGDTAKVVNYKQGVLAGKQRYYLNNKLVFSETLVGGELNGEKIEYYPNGQIEAFGMILNGKQNGEWIIYHDNGQIQNILLFDKGIMKGPLINYHRNGQIALKGNDSSGNGLIDYYDSLGNLVWKINFKDGIAIDTLEFHSEYITE